MTDCLGLDHTDPAGFPEEMNARRNGYSSV